MTRILVVDDQALVRAGIRTLLGIAGIDVNAVDVPLPTGKGLGIGALAVGNVKYQTQCRLFRRMLQADQPLCLDFRDAYELAVEVTG